MSKVRRSLRIEETLDVRIEKQRDKENRSYNNMVEVLCERQLGVEDVLNIDEKVFKKGGKKKND